MVCISLKVISKVSEFWISFITWFCGTDATKEMMKFFKNLYDPILLIGFNCLKAAESIRWDSLLLTIKFQEFPILIWSPCERCKTESTMEPPQGLETGIPGMVFHERNHEATQWPQKWMYYLKRYIVLNFWFGHHILLQTIIYSLVK